MTVTLIKQPDIGGRPKGLGTASLGPWLQWRGMSRHARAIRFIETYCRAPKGYGAGQLINLADFQKEWLEEVLQPGIHAAVESMARGNGKSTFKSAFGLWGTFDPGESGDPQVPVIASTIKQACKTIFNPAIRMIRMEPELVSRCKIYTALSDTKIVVPSVNGEMFPISDDPDGLQGLDPYIGLVDEIGFLSIESWASLLLATGKRSDSLIIAIGTPGFTRDSALYHVRQNHMHDENIHYTEYAADEGCALDDEEQRRKSNPAYVAGFKGKHAFDVAMTLPESLFRIFQLGQWVDGTDAWLGPDGRRLWNALRHPQELASGVPTWVGLDVGLKRDSTALVAVQRGLTGNLHATCRLWVPGRDQPVDLTDVMQHIRLLDNLYDVKEIVYDPRLFEVPATMLSDEGLNMVEFPQSIERMSPAFGLLFELIKQEKLSHNGDEAFTTQILNAMPRYNDRGFTLKKRDSRGKIDACYALAMAIARAHVQERTVPTLEVA